MFVPDSLHIPNSGLHHRGQFRGNLIDTMCALRVSRALLHYVVNGFAGCLKITINPHVTTGNRLCHCGFSPSACNDIIATVGAA
jgi:hypothetical protein